MEGRDVLKWQNERADDTRSDFCKLGRDQRKTSPIQLERAVYETCLVGESFELFSGAFRAFRFWEGRFEQACEGSLGTKPSAS